MGFKYGRLPRDFSKPALALENYLTDKADGTLPPAPLQVDRASKVSSWPMYGNDTIGDCTCAAIGHMIQAWTAYAGAEVTVPQSSVIGLYSAVSGYNPATGANDNGAEMSDVLAYMKSTGIKDSAGKVHKVAGYAAFGDCTDIPLMKQVLNVAGSVYTGINCPASAQTEFGQVWTYEPSSPIEGGHCIDLQLVAGGGVGAQSFVTWGALQKATIGFIEHYVEEAWFVVSQDYIDANGTTIEGLDLQSLLADMQDVT